MTTFTVPNHTESHIKLTGSEIGTTISAETKDALKAIDDNIRLAQVRAHSTLLK